MLGDHRLAVGRDRAALVARLLGPLRAGLADSRKRRLRAEHARWAGRKPRRLPSGAISRPRIEMTTQSGAGDQLADGAEPARSTQRTAPESPAVPDDNTIRVSLGRPEPLPGPCPCRVGALRASPRRAPRPEWKAETKEPVALHRSDLSAAG